MQRLSYRNDFLKIILLIICLIVATHIYPLPVWANKLLKSGTKAPDFKYPDSAGKQKWLSEVKGKKIVLLYFWDNDPPGIPQKPNAEGLNYVRLISRQYSSDVLVLTIFISEPSAKLYGAEDVTPVWYLIDYEGKISFVYDGNLGKATTRVLGDKIVSLKKDFLSKQLAKLIVSFTPPDADVFLDGSPIDLQGKNPSTIENIKPGTYTLRIVKTGYQTWLENISLSRGEVKTIRVTLEEEPGILDVRVKPDNSVVYLNGERIGKTPFTVKLKPDTYTLRVTAGDKYRNASQEVVITNGQTQQIGGTLQRLKGGVKVLSTPGEADIYLNDAKKGITPKVFKDLDADDYTLKLTKEGYRDYTQMLRIREGMLPNINVTLEKITVKLARRRTTPTHTPIPDTPIPSPEGRKPNRVWWYVGGTAVVTGVATGVVLALIRSKTSKKTPVTVVVTLP